MHVGVRDERLVLDVVCEAEGFDVLLETRRDAVLVAPEAVAGELGAHGLEEELYLAELLAAFLCSVERESAVV